MENNISECIKNLTYFMEKYDGYRKFWYQSLVYNFLKVVEVEHAKIGAKNFMNRLFTDVKEKNYVSYSMFSWKINMSMKDSHETSNTVKSLIHFLEKDEDYCRSWYDNLTMALYDANESVTLNNARLGAKSFLKNFMGIDYEKIEINLELENEKNKVKNKVKNKIINTFGG